MEQILRGKEMGEITFLPIRHHSPACAYHVKQMIEKHKPDYILIEGPINANDLIPIMVHEDTKAPFAIYYSYQDKSGVVSEEKENYKCYYPFLDYSPELVALRQGMKQNIPVSFIDMPYGGILAASSEGKGLRAREEKNNYNDDYLLARSRYIKELCRKTGLRSFDEFWEKYFEINGLYEESETFFSHMETYCRLCRESTPREAMEEDGCLKREAYMADVIWNLQETSRKGSQIIVITGGFHVPGLKTLFNHPEQMAKPKQAGMEPENQGVYLMPYSMEAADALNGYASGMPCPGFYQNVWNGLDVSKENVYEEAVLAAIVKTGKEVRKKEGYLSSYDEICAFSMAGGLAALRNKGEPGAYELKDAILSSFVKGEYNLSTDTPMRILQKVMTGAQIGKLCSEAQVPPIVKDFEALCKDHHLKIHSTLSQEITLTIFSSKKHREISMFFNQVIFLDTEFAIKVKGPNLRLKKDKNLIREIWKYKWNSQVIAALIDASVYGGTIYEACTSLVLSRLKKEFTGKEAALLLTQVFEMGLKEQLNLVYDRVRTQLLSDSDFYSMADALSYLIMLEEMSGLYQSALDFRVLIELCIQKLTGLLPSMAQIKDEELSNCMEAVKTLYRLVKRPEYQNGQDGFYQSLWQVLSKETLHPGIHGCIMGILFGSGQVLTDQVELACYGYLMGTRSQVMKAAAFFRGLFYTARDLVFIEDRFIRIIDRFISQAGDQDFLELLPELRMAFGYFTPRETDQIAEKAARLHGKEKRDLYELPEILPEYYSYGSRLDKQISELVERSKIHGKG